MSSKYARNTTTKLQLLESAWQSMKKISTKDSALKSLSSKVYRTLNIKWSYKMPVRSLYKLLNKTYNCLYNLSTNMLTFVGSPISNIC